MKQGLLNDPWVLGSAAALAEEPDLVKRLFKQQDYPADGRFDVQLYYRGKPYVVTVDDQLPLYRENVPLAMQQSEDGAWWPAILEKAYAKMHQNYARIEGGLTFESLRTLTGMPVIAHLPMYFRQLYTPEKVIGIITEAQKKSYVVSAGIFKDHEGLSAGHAYTVLGIDRVKDQGKEEALVRMRNPWAKERYAGPWADNDKRWTAEAK